MHVTSQYPRPSTKLQKYKATESRSHMLTIYQNELWNVHKVWSLNLRMKSIPWRTNVWLVKSMVWFTIWSRIPHWEWHQCNLMWSATVPIHLFCLHMTYGKGAHLIHFKYLLYVQTSMSTWTHTTNSLKKWPMNYALTLLSTRICLTSNIFRMCNFNMNLH